MSEIPASKAREQLSELINQVAYGKEPVVLTRRGKKLVAIIPIEDLERIEEIEEAEDLQDVEETLARLANGEEKTIPWKDVKASLGRE